MIYKLISVRQVIAKIVRDLGLGHQEIPMLDMIEWIGEALSQIGAYAQFTPKEVVIPVVNHVGLVPCDFYQLINLKKGCSLESSRSRYDIVSDALDALGLREEGAPPISREAFMLLQTATYEKGVSFDESLFYNNLRSNESFINSYSMNMSITGNSYRFDKDTQSVQTAFRDGFITMSYLAFPVDCDNFPLVPDLPSFTEAMLWKVTFKLRMKGHAFQVPELNSLEYSRNYWNFYCLQARGHANAPNLEKLDQYSKLWTSIVPYYHEYDNDFKHVGRYNGPNLEGQWRK